jgi:Mrp family chromosome partitioning ATPase
MPAQPDVMPPQPETAAAGPEVAPPRAQVLPEDGSSNTTLMRWTDTEAIVPVRQSPSFVLEEAEIPAVVDARLVMLQADAEEQARAYRLLRHRLLSEGDPRVIAVTSAEPGEGKSTCAANLALALADETMARVLLVEANLRRPALGEIFGFEPADSFVRRMVEQRDASPSYPVAAVRGTRLHVAALPALRTRELRLDRLLLDTALHDLRGSYDYIVIDAAAVLESADADVAGECADGVVLVARAQSSHRAALEEAMSQLHPTRVLGTVVLDT